MGDLWISWVLFLLLLFFCLWAVQRQFSAWAKVLIGVGVLVKISIALAVGWYFEKEALGKDTWYLFAEAKNILAWCTDRPWDFFRMSLGYLPDGDFFFHNQPRAFYAAWLLVVPTWLAGGDYILTASFLALFISFAYLFLFRQIALLGWNIYPWLLALLFWPSVVFWSSGILKETLMLGSVALILGFTLTPVVLGARPKWWQLLGGAVMFFVLWQFKYYAAGILFIVLVATWVGNALTSRWGRGGWLGYFATWLLSAALAMSTYPRLYPDQLLASLYGNYLKFQELTGPLQRAEFPSWDGTFWGGLRSFSLVITTALFRPLPWETWNLWSMLAGIENMIVLVLVAAVPVVTPLWKSIPQPTSRLRLSGLAFLAFSALLIGLATPNFGTLLRYRTLYMPLLICWLGYRYWAWFFPSRK